VAKTAAGPDSSFGGVIAIFARSCCVRNLPRCPSRIGRDRCRARSSSPTSWTSLRSSRARSKIEGVEYRTS
jgi:hypothetical protein